MKKKVGSLQISSYLYVKLRDMKFRWKCNADDRRKAVTRKIKSLLKEEPILPEKLMKGYYTDFVFQTTSGNEYRFYYAGGDTPRGGIYFLVPTK